MVSDPRNNLESKVEIIFYIHFKFKDSYLFYFIYVDINLIQNIFIALKYCKLLTIMYKIGIDFNF